MSLSSVKPAFALPKLLQLQGLSIEGYGTGFWDVSSAEQTVEDIDALLKAVHPTLIELTLAGYQVERLIFSTKEAAPWRLLDIDLATLRYEILAYTHGPDEHSLWYARTGTEWATVANGASEDGIPSLPSDTWAAAAMVFRPRDYPQTGEVTYALDLAPMLIEADALLAELSDTQQSLVVYDALPSSGEPPASTMQNILKSLLFLLIFSQGTFRDRWLAVDCAPVGLLHNLNPDKLVDCLHPDDPVPTGSQPSRWGCPPTLSPALSQIIEVCRQVWRYLEHKADFFDAYGDFTVDPTWQLLRATWGYLQVEQQITLPAVSPRDRQHEFMNAIREKVRQDTGLGLPDDILKQLEDLPWVELLFFLHNSYVIDLLSGVHVEAGTAVVAHAPDRSGWYQSADGLITVQLNQAENYIWGFMQVRHPRTFDGYEGTFHEINYYDIVGGGFFLYKRGHLSDPETFEIANETIATNSDGQLVLEWTLSKALSGTDTLSLTRYLEQPVLPDEAIDGLPKDMDGKQSSGALVFELAHRAPLGPAGEAVLQTAAGIIQEYVQQYHGSLFQPGDTKLDKWETDLRRTFRQFLHVTANGDRRENDQFALARYGLRAILQATPMDLGEADTRSLYNAFLELIGLRGAGHLAPIDSLIIDIAGITFEEVSAILDEHDGEPLTTGPYVYEFRMVAVSAGISFFLVGKSTSPTIVLVRRLGNPSDPSGIYWSANYFGVFEAGGLSIGLNVKVDPKKLVSEALKMLSGSKGSWSKIYAHTLWERSDFAGPITVFSRQATIYVWQATFLNKTTFFELEKGQGVGYGRLVSVTRNYTPREIWKGSEFVLGVGTPSYNALLAFANLLRIAFTGDVADQDFFEPLLQIESYTSTIPTQTGQVHFEPDLSTLNDNGRAALQQLAAKFRAYFMSPLTLLEVHGHASPKGSAAYNLDLSARRAQTVYNYLYAILGDAFAVPTQHTIVMGHGEWDALYLGQVPQGAEVAEWRRVDVLLNGALVASMFGENPDADDVGSVP